MCIRDRHQGGATIPKYGNYYHFIRNRIWFAREWGTRTESIAVCMRLVLTAAPRVLIADCLKRRGFTRTRSIFHALIDGLREMPGSRVVSIDEPRPAQWGRWQ